jgi:hypothetical protein
MRLVRSIGSVVVGYLIFAFSAFGFFQITGQAPHQAAPPSVMFASIAVGVIAACVGGFVAALLAGRRPLVHGVAVAAILALGAAVSLLSTIGQGAVWSHLAAIFLMAPAAAFGGWVRERLSKRS